MILLNEEKSKLFCEKSKIKYKINEKIKKLDRLIDEYEKTINYEYMECPKCKSNKLVGYGSYKRNIVINEETRVIRIKRVQCKNCKCTHAIIPEYIKPYFVYESSYIDFCMLLIKIRRKTKKEIERIFGISRQIIRKWEIRFNKHKIYIMTTFKLKKIRKVINKTFESGFIKKYMKENEMRYFS